MSVLQNAIYITIFHFFFVSTLVFAESLPLEVYGKLPDKSMLRISPDASKIAYRSVTEDGDAVIIIDLQKKRLLGGINVSEIDPRDIYFVNENQLILVASEDKKILGYRGEHRVSTAFVFDIDSKELRQLLVPGRGIYEAQTGLGRVSGLSPDGKYLYMPAYSGKHHDDLTYDLMRVNLTRKGTPRKHKRGRLDAIDYFVDASGEVLARERFDEFDDLHRVESMIDDEWREIYREETPYITKSIVGVTPTGDALVVLAENDEGFSSYYAMNLTNGEITGPLFNREDADIEAVLTDINRVVYGVRYSGFKPSYGFFDKALDNKLKAIAKAMPENTFTIVDFTENFNHIVFKVDGDGAAGEYFLYGGGEFVYLTSSRKLVTSEFVNQVIEYEYMARDGLKIPSLLTVPTSANGNLQKMPAIMLPHGGPESYDRIHFHWLAQYFASRGYVVIQPQFRGSAGFGAEFTRKGRGEWGKKMMDDLEDAVADLAQQGIIDPNKVCIAGISYGGYAAIAGATFTPDLYKCAISVNGISDVKLMMSRERRDHGKRSSVVAYWQDVIKNNSEDSELMEKISPINYAEKVKIPVLLIHGEKDLIVDVEQSENMFEKLKDANKDVTFVELPDENHYLRNNSTRLQALKAIDTFISKHL
ncbi:MAG: prolyl oligopeptidase family serine peptidase [Aestuariibacter sp.]